MERVIVLSGQIIQVHVGSDPQICMTMAHGENLGVIKIITAHPVEDMNVYQISGQSMQ